MASFHYYHPIEVRYSDLDPQGHLNNSRYLTYFEQARIAYIQHLGLWQAGDFTKMGIILADAHVTFRSAVQFGQQIRVGVRVSRLGRKSMNMEYCIEDEQARKVMAEGSTVVVAYEYATGQTLPVPQDWRQKIVAFEQLEPI